NSFLALVAHPRSTTDNVDDPAARGRHVAGGGAGAGRSSLDRVHSRVFAPDQRLAGRRVPARGRVDRRRHRRRRGDAGRPRSGGRAMTALPGPETRVAGAPGGTVAAQWVQLHAAAPLVVATIGRYLQRLSAFLAPASVYAADNALRQFAA